MANIVNERDTALQATVPRLIATSITISSAGGSGFTKTKNTNTLTPVSMTLNVVTTGFTSASKAWYYASSASISTFNSVSEATVLGLTSANFLTHLGTGTFVRYKCVASQFGWTTVETYFDISFTEQANDLPVLSVSKDNIVLPTTSGDVCTYSDAYTEIDVSIGGTPVPYAASGNNTYSVSIGTIVGTTTITPSTITNTRRLTISGMNGTGLTATASVPITITVIDSRGTVTTFNKSLAISKVTSGTSGNSSGIAYAYKRSATDLATGWVASTNGPGAITWTFSSGSITTPATDALLNEWTKAIPSGTDPLYVTVCTAAGTSAAHSVAATEWATPAKLTQNGLDGLNIATATLYQRNASPTVGPTAQANTVTLTFATGGMTGMSAGWTSAIPAASSGAYLWVTRATASASGAWDTLTSGEWSTPVLFVQDGTTGTPGTRGSRQLYASSASYTSSYNNGAGVGFASYSAQATALIASATTGTTPTTPINGDSVWFSNVAGTYAYTLAYNGSAWATPGTVIDGSLLVTESVTASKINSNGLSIKDGSGNVILSAGSPLASTNITPSSAWLNSNVTYAGLSDTKPPTNANYTQLSGGLLYNNGVSTGVTVANSSITISGGAISGIGTGDGTAVANSSITGATLTSNGVWATLPASGATVGGTFGVNIGGQMTSLNASTYIASAAIGDALIGSLAASKITAGTITAAVSLNSNGYVIANGASGDVTYDSSGYFNKNGTTNYGVVAKGTINAVFGLASNSAWGVVGSTANGRGVSGFASGTGWGVYAEGSAAITGNSFKATGAATINGQLTLALASGGVAPLVVTSTTLCTNLNAQLWNGMKVSVATNGTGTPTLAANKPTAGSAGQTNWLRLDIGGSFYYIPAWV